MFPSTSLNQLLDLPKKEKHIQASMTEPNIAVDAQNAQTGLETLMS
jgi:hypothetical protein